jgi:hypothetical protein
MTTSEPDFKAFNDYGVEDIHPRASISRRMLERLEEIDDDTAAGPKSPAARAALASSVVAHAVVELESKFIELKKSLS